MTTGDRLQRQHDPRTNEANIDRLATIHRLMNEPGVSSLSDLYDLPATPSTTELARWTATLFRTLTGKRH